MLSSEEENTLDMEHEERLSDQVTNDLYEQSHYLESLKCRHDGCDKYIPDHSGTEEFDDSDICFENSHRTPEDYDS